LGIWQSVRVQGRPGEDMGEIGSGTNLHCQEDNMRYDEKEMIVNEENPFIFMSYGNMRHTLLL
jgi:hypothetical protein